MESQSVNLSVLEDMGAKIDKHVMKVTGREDEAHPGILFSVSYKEETNGTSFFMKYFAKGESIVA